MRRKHRFFAIILESIDIDCGFDDFCELTRFPTTAPTNALTTSPTVDNDNVLTVSPTVDDDNDRDDNAGDDDDNSPPNLGSGCISISTLGCHL